MYLCPKYAEDITYVTTSLEKLEEIEKDTPPKLKPYNLQVNQSVRTRLDSQHTTCDTRKHINELEGMQTSGNKVRHQCRHKKT